MARAELEAALTDGSSAARVRELLRAELGRGAAELRKPRAGREEPVTVVFAPDLVAVAPVAAGIRADPSGDRLASALLAALGEVAGGEVAAGEHHGYLGLAADGDAELACLAFDEIAEGIDRLRARALLVPALELKDVRPLLATAREEDIRPHDDPDPVRRIARRQLQRLSGLGKWGGFHTEFSHLYRGFDGSEKQLARDVGEALLAGGLLTEKPSVGQRHVSLNSRRAGEIHRFVEAGEVPADLTLPFI